MGSFPSLCSFGKGLRQMKAMSLLLAFSLCSIVSSQDDESCTKAQQLLSWDDHADEFTLGMGGLDKLQSLEPGVAVSVLGFVGEARQGKSTTLNAIVNDMQPFYTSDSFDAATRGVLVHTKGSRVYLDIEGIDLGKDAVVDQLSAVAGLLSSDLALFVQGRPKNKDIDFLLRFCHLMGSLSKGASSMATPRLHVIVREPLKGLNGTTIQKFLLGAQDDDRNPARREIQKHFASLEFHPLANLDNEVEYKKDVALLRKKMNTLKMSTSGTLWDGAALSEILEKRLFKHIKEEDYPFDTAFLSMEKAACERHFNKLVGPVMEIKDVTKFRVDGQQALKEFATLCHIISARRHASKLFEMQAEMLEAEEADRKLRRDLDEEKQKNDERAHKQKMEQMAASQAHEKEILKLQQEAQEAHREAEARHNMEMRRAADLQAAEAAAAERKHKEDMARIEAERQKEAQMAQLQHDRMLKEMEDRAAARESAHAQQLDRTNRRKR